jgi:hypothetical protein
MNSVVLRNSVALLLMLAAVSAYKSYSWNRWLGEQGSQGQPGTPHCCEMGSVALRNKPQRFEHVSSAHKLAVPHLWGP